jgi:hypothetical protein
MPEGSDAQNEDRTQRTVNVETLRALGVPEDLINEAVRREESGVLETEQPADLLERIIKRGESQLLGHKMTDGTVYAGTSPDTGKAMFAAPSDAPLTYTFNEAAGYSKQLNAEKYLGHDDWRVPTKAELNVLYENRNKGALQGTFNLAGPLPAAWYWSSTEGDFNAWGQRFGDGDQGWGYRYVGSSLRCVRG